MKKILIVSHAMEIGGAEKALLGLLETIDTTQYQVDLFLLRHQGELLKDIPENINLLPAISEYSDLAVPIMNVLKKGHFRIAYGRFKAKRAAKKRVVELGLEKNDVGLEYSHKFTARYMPPISQEDYDAAISFLTPHYFVTEKVKAKKKVAWIHTDYSAVSVDKESQLEMWSPYDHIASISDKAAEAFISVFPTLKEKVVTIQNILPQRYIERQTNAFSAENEMPNDGTIKLLSIGRFCVAKNFDNVPEICKLIREQGLNIKWYLIGFGADEQLIKRKITEFHMEEYVIILGKKENPYPYIKTCDLYVQPSRFEGRCVSVTEAQMLGKPVVITDYPTSASQLEDGVDGIIVPLGNDRCAERIANVIQDKELQHKVIDNTKSKDYSNKSEINVLYDLIDN